MRILITGATGFIGKHLTDNLYALGHEIVVIGAKVGENKVPCHRFLTAHLNGVNFDALKNIDVVFHQAASNDTTDADRQEMLNANLVAPSKLFHWLAYNGTQRFIYASSCAVYGNESAPYDEEKTPLRPLNPYGESKAFFDESVMRWAEKNKLNVVGLRYSNVYGTGEGHKGKRASMIFQMAKQIRKENLVRLFKMGEQKRDWVYVKDVVTMNLAALAWNGAGIFNCGSGEATSFNRILEILNGNLGTEARAEYVDNPHQGYQHHTECNMSKAASLLNFKPLWSVENGIADFLETDLLE